MIGLHLPETGEAAEGRKEVMERTDYMGEKAFLLENDFLRAVILPERGGKAASLFGKETGMEILYQNRKGKFDRAEFGSDFGQFEACGYDDAFPGVDEEQVEVGGKLVHYPDHGEIWSAPFKAETEGERLHLFYHSFRMHYDYTKEFWLEGKQLCCGYEITNGGDTAFPCIWTIHCLVNSTPGMRIVFPEGTRQVENVFSCKHLGKAGTVYDYPRACINGREYWFDRLPEDDMVKYYVTEPVEADGCGYDYPETGTRVRIYYDRKILPYLGCWITAGGYRGEKNCALEPCSGYYDSIRTAKAKGKGGLELGPGETKRFCIRIAVDAL